LNLTPRGTGILIETDT